MMVIFLFIDYLTELRRARGSFSARSGSPPSKPRRSFERDSKNDYTVMAKIPPPEIPKRRPGTKLSRPQSVMYPSDFTPKYDVESSHLRRKHSFSSFGFKEN